MRKIFLESVFKRRLEVKSGRLLNLIDSILGLVLDGNSAIL